MIKYGLTSERLLDQTHGETNEKFNIFSIGEITTNDEDEICPECGDENVNYGCVSDGSIGECCWWECVECGATWGEA